MRSEFLILGCSKGRRDDFKYKLTNNNKNCKIGEAGELSVKTPSIFSGYYGKNSKNVKKNNYFKTGDIFTKDDKGSLAPLL